MSEREIFMALLDLEDPQARVAFLDRVCEGDRALRERVEALVESDRLIGNFLVDPVPASTEWSPTVVTFNTHAPAAESDADDFRFLKTQFSTHGSRQPAPRNAAPPRILYAVGDVIADRYTLIERLGEGGMGTVFKAEQSRPIKRLVALKLIRGGMDSREVLARFEAERQALALMDHPNIARVFDGGSAGENLPFFAMELVIGEPITKYCDRLRLSVRARLELFTVVCQAVQHAHQKGIIHRDLKPGNVLVTEVDGRPTPKVIDFGVAKATEFKLTEETLAEGLAIVGTPEYMSPEQADPASMDIDTRTDVYSLGVLLYELLIGSPPLDEKEIKRGGILEMLRMVREVDPPKPSTKLTGLDSIIQVADNRDLDPEALKRALRGDLDWIVMKAIDKDRTRRYETATGLAADIQRHLSHEPVKAAPPSRGYRCRKFVRKHKGAVLAALSLIFVLMAGIAGTTWGLFREARLNQDLVAKNRELAAAQAKVDARNRQLAAEQSKVQARFELARRAIATFHTGVSEDVLLRNEQFRGLREKLLGEATRFYADLAKLLAEDTDPRARSALADGYRRLGILTDKIGSGEESLARFRDALRIDRELAAEPGATLNTRLQVARDLSLVGCSLLGLDRSEEAVEVFREAVSIADRLNSEAESYQVLDELATARANLGGGLRISGRNSEARPEFEKGLEIQLKLLERYPTRKDARISLAWQSNNLGHLYRAMNRPADALAVFREAYRIYSEVDKESPNLIEYERQVAGSLNNCALALGDLGKTREALEDQRKALEIRKKIAEAEPAEIQNHQDLSWCLGQIALLLVKERRMKEAAAAHSERVEMYRKRVESNPELSTYQGSLAESYLDRAEVEIDDDRVAEAVADVRSAMGVYDRMRNPDQWSMFRRAGAFARLAGLSGDPKSGIAADEVPTLRSRVMLNLNKAVANGWTDPTDLDRREFDSMRNQADFESLRRELTKKKKAVNP